MNFINSRKVVRLGHAVVGMALLALAGCSAVTPVPRSTPKPQTTSATPVSELGTPAAAGNPSSATPTGSLGTGGRPGGLTGRIAIQALDNSIQLVDGSGNKETLAQLGAAADFLAVTPPGNVVGDAIYVVTGGSRSQVWRVDPSGARGLDWIKGQVTGLAVSADQVAWATANLDSTPPSTRLFLSRLDGSGARMVLTETDNTAPHALKPLRWSQDGKVLYFSKEPVGLGGYILFDGSSNLWSLDPATGKTTEVAASPHPGSAICIDDVSPDGREIADHCNQISMEVATLPAGQPAQVISLPSNMSPAGAVGGARFSPDGSRLAYGLARNKPDDEQGWVAVSSGLNGGSTVIATSPAHDFFQVAAWPDAETIVLQSGGNQPGVWTVQADGSNLKRLTDGHFIGMVSSAQSGAAVTSSAPAIGTTEAPLPAPTQTAVPEPTQTSTPAPTGTAAPTEAGQAPSATPAAAETSQAPAETPTEAPPTATPGRTVQAPSGAAPGGNAGVSRISFTPGSIQATVSGSLDAGQSADYVLTALQGQTMTVNLSPPGAARVDVYDAAGVGLPGAQAGGGGTSWTGQLPATQDYIVRVTAGQSATDYSLTVTIPPLGAAGPGNAGETGRASDGGRITFAPGSYSATVSGATTEGQSVSYVLRARAGQTMTVTLTGVGGRAVLALFGASDGQPLVSAANRWTYFTRRLPATQDYVLEVIPTTGTSMQYSLSITIH